jgi:hypothetical protein
LIASTLKPLIHLPKLPVRTRLDAAKVFVDYLSTSEEREVTLGAVAQHPLFGAHRFVPAMRTALGNLDAVLSRNENS